MKFVKKTIIMKNPTGGAATTAKLTSVGDKIEFCIKLPTVGKYILIVKAKGFENNFFELTNSSCIKLDGTLSDASNIEFVVIDINSMQPILYGSTASTMPPISTMLDGLSRFLNSTSRVIEPKIEKKPIFDEHDMDNQPYEVHEENIVDDNYEIHEENFVDDNYDNEQSYEDSQDNVEDMIEDSIHPFNAKDSTIKCVEQNDTSDDTACQSSSHDTTNDPTQFIISLDDTVLDSETEGNKEPIYYKNIERDLVNMLDSFEPITELENKILGSRWARVTEETGSDYAVGVIYDEDQIPLYVCYAIEGNADSKVDENYNYVAIDDEHGYWIMYQNATDGSVINID